MTVTHSVNENGGLITISFDSLTQNSAGNRAGSAITVLPGIDGGPALGFYFNKVNPHSRNAEDELAGHDFADTKKTKRHSRGNGNGGFSIHYGDSKPLSSVLEDLVTGLKISLGAEALDYHDLLSMMSSALPELFPESRELFAKELKKLTTPNVGRFGDGRIVYNFDPLTTNGISAVYTVLDGVTGAVSLSDAHHAGRIVTEFGRRFDYELTSRADARSGQTAVLFAKDGDALNLAARNATATGIISFLSDKGIIPKEIAEIALAAGKELESSPVPFAIKKETGGHNVTR